MADWPGLLAWSTKYHDGTKPSEFKRMTDEDRAFLEKAMEEAFGQIEDPNKIMAEAIGQIKAADRSEASILTALEVIDRSCDDVDCARNVEKLDGIQPLLDLLTPPKSQSDAISERTLEILALLFANNPNIQEVGARRGGIDIFLQLISAYGVGTEPRGKAFRALVALVRASPSEAFFMKEKDGLNVIISCINQEDLRLCEKVASFIISLGDRNILLPEHVGPLATALTPFLQSIGSQGGIQYRETLANCIAKLGQVSPSNCPAEMKAAAKNGMNALTSDDDTVARESLTEFLVAMRKGEAA